MSPRTLGAPRPMFKKLIEWINGPRTAENDIIEKYVGPQIMPDIDVEKLTQCFAEATKKAVFDLHDMGLPAHGEIDGVWQEIPPRPTWDQIWMRMAHLIAQRSIDPRTKVGAIVVSADNTRVLGIGYNGDYRGGPNAVESLEPGKSGTIHAELNALIKCDYLPEMARAMYVTSAPCLACAKLIINARIPVVVYDVEYRDPAGLELLRANGVTVRQFTP